MTTFQTGYLPSRHGFRFGNDFPDHTVGPLTMRGRAAGMCAVSLDYFRAGRAAPVVESMDFGLRAVSGVGVASWAVDHAELFVCREGGQLATKRLDASGYSHWCAVTRACTSLSPDAAAGGPGRVDLVVRGIDRRLRHRWYAGDATEVCEPCRPPADLPEALDGILDSAPAVAAPHPDRIDVYALGADRGLWCCWYDRGGWHGWVSLGRPSGVTLTCDPAAAGQPGWRTVLIRGSDGAIWQREYASRRWRPWRCLGGVATSAPAIASPYPGRAEAYLRGTDGNIHQSIYEDGRWQRWISLGAPPTGLTTQRPAAVSHAALMDVYALANDGSVWHKRWSNGWQPWQSTEVTISPAARRLDDAIRHRLTADTLGPLRATGPFGSFALSLVGTAGAFLGLLQQPRDSTFHRAATDEMAMLATLLRAGEPVSVGLLADGLGHEVVAYAGEVNAGGQSRLHVYDPGYPGCDQATITIDPIHRRIMSSTGETWQALWVRHDVPTNTPPV